ncbi:orotidine-5'-phosphate decarboxylase [Oharaeibacter diazotrophicus]|uniref:Orotidine-5'-phosphate decarboxylase n=1 Tax=Oharaeibacter diazotrophicus TaxID=1920512 RepID=A0A4R6RD23_9HYPH|nr:orotidine-5'-phosphate decarboxylase [Oharaeibacter diazotrophicus]TDP83596.1 orotidine-5'-phosphate decarboxylase [Oharaeibacter diazotrophicus]BBE72429.1 orotidine 5'-phosphate decarboxylase [Pleomorphomonas sp. SM30]GLS79199.1 orotidine 5'-phosphate decarboxylase [Oharaeibacter diazotrophicus]
MSIQPFSVRFDLLAGKRSPLCVGIDPTAETLARWDLPFSAEGARVFGLELVEAVGDVTAVFKPQVAYFERFGWQGLKAVDEVLRHARSADALAIADVKRMDIGSTLEAYAAAWLGEDAGIRADAMTLGAYMGAGSLKPVVERAAAAGAGLFVVVRSSNPDGIALQNARHEDDRTVAEALADDIAAFNAPRLDANGLGPVGAVVGATLDDADAVLERLKSSIVLAPGIGAQGATMADLKARFGRTAARRAMPTASRQIGNAGPSRRAIREVVLRLAEEAHDLR